MKRSRCWDFISSNTLAKRRAQNANDADIATVQRNYRFEYFLLYFYDTARGGEETHVSVGREYTSGDFVLQIFPM